MLGDKFNGLQWHVYVADADGIQYGGRQPCLNFEVCMTDLHPEAAQQFFRTEKFVSAERTTTDTGIRALVPQVGNTSGPAGLTGPLFYLNLCWLDRA